MKFLLHWKTKMHLILIKSIKETKENTIVRKGIFKLLL